jgi:membrane-bound serine protease (ClpP class)
MMTREVPGVRVGLEVLLPAVLVLSVAVLLLGRLALAAQRLPPATGVEALTGQRAHVRSTIVPGESGLVSVHGELWQARSDVPIDAGAVVRVTAVNGLTLTVVPDHTPDRRGDTAWKA